MSVVDATPSVTVRGGTTRAVALGGGVALTASYLSVLYEVTSVVGGTDTLTGIVLASAAVATVLALAVSPRVAAALTGGLFLLGAVVYMEAAPLGWLLLDNVGKVTADTAALLTGVSVLRMQAAGAWALGFAPAPVFLSWYLFVRRRYDAGVAVGGTALLAFVLTGDAGPTVTLVGVVGGAVAVGFGELEWRGLSIVDVEVLAVLLAVMVVATTTVSVVPAGTSGDTFFPGGGSPTVEASVTGAGERMEVVGSVSLSPEVRFTVESNRPAYWRVGAYDRYTGEGWARTGMAREYDEDLLRSGRGQRVVQRVEVRSRMQVIPAAWRPIGLDGDAEDVAQVSSLGGLQANEPLEDGDDYTVVSSVPDPPEETLRDAGDDYPDALEDRYTQLPSDAPERLETFTDRITDGSEGPYETATRIQTWLKANKEYSLNVERPDDDVATGFVFDMDAGYCTYFATSMVAMLRTQGVPARMAVGYTTGQRVAGDQWVVRGYNAHAWVEVFFPDVGWVKFDPTPARDRRNAQNRRLEDARQNDRDDVDVDDSEEGTWTPTPTQTPETPTPTPGGPVETPTGDGNETPPGRTPRGPDVDPNITPAGGTGGGGYDGPRKEVVALGLIVAAGVAAGVRRSRAVPRLRQWVGTYYQRPSADPDHDAERAARRLEHALGRQYRERRPGETYRAYFEALAALERDDRLVRVGHIYERAVYGGGVDRETADEAIELVDAAVRDHAPLLSR